jgi:lipoate-protein ligase A
MATDEALFRLADAPVLRFYRWAGPELSIGYFVRLESLPDRNLPITRRWTGGGVVEHGEDVVFSLIIPAKFGESDRIPALFPETAGDRYRWIHQKLAEALTEAGLEIALESPRSSAPSAGGRCFVAAVGHDLIDAATGRKVAGGAQRASRGALLHQGSVRLPKPLRDLRSPWTRAFAERLGETVHVSDPWRPDPEVRNLTASLVESRYGTPSWRGRF